MKLLFFVRFFLEKICDRIYKINDKILIQEVQKMSENKAKKVKDIFSDYETKSNIQPKT